MENQLSHLLEFFPTGTAEGEKSILDRVFIYANEFEQVISPPRNSPHLLVGTKGSGKTAVLQFSRRMLEAKGAPSVYLTAFDIDTSSMIAELSTGDLARQFYAVLLDSIISRAVRDSTTFSTGDLANVREYATSRGIFDRSFTERARDAISSAAKEITGIDINAAVSNLTDATRTQVLGAIQRIVGRRSFYLFIDDTDQVGQPGVAGHLNRVWALILAVRKLTQDIDGLAAVVTLRTEIWSRLQRDEHGQRDQTDHFRTLVVKMKSDRDHVGRVIDRRLALAASAVRSPVDPYQRFFDGPVARAPMSDEKRLWRDLILVRTRNRPRDAIQMINELAKRAMDRGLDRIDETTFQFTVPPFSKSMTEQLAEEVRPEFPEFLEHFKSLAGVEFSEGAFTLTADGALKHFQRMLSRHGATISGVRLDQNAPDSAFSVWRFFYQAGVLNARISDSSMPGGFNHKNADDDPYLVTRSRWNELQGMLWEINTSYRDYMIELQKERALNTGLPVKRNNRKNRR